MSRPALLIRKYALLTHRWLGVIFCALFVVWFISGIVLMYWDFPTVSARDRLAKSPSLDASAIHISPQEAFAKLESDEVPARVRLLTLDGRPIYRFQFVSSSPPTTLDVYADDGQLAEITPAMAQRIAMRWADETSAPTLVEPVKNLDQWTVFPEVRRGRPYWKFAWADGQEVYISQATGDVSQHTTRATRFAAWTGAIPHWLYFTDLRKDTPLWRTTVTWISFVGVVMTLLGIVVGLWLYSPSRRYRFPDGPSSIPYAGYKRWHTIFGLVFGLVTFTWILSGMFSMTPFLWSPDSGPEAPQKALEGEPWKPDKFAALDPRQALEAVQKQVNGFQVRELRLTTALGQPAYLAVQDPVHSMVVPVSGEPFVEYDPAKIRDVMAQGAAGLVAGAVNPIAEVRRITEYEAYYLDRHHRKPLPALFVRLNDADQSIYYVDLKTAQVVESYDARSRWNRWLYHGLHSMDLPWLYRNRPAWDLTVLALMLGGNALCVTSVVIGWRRLRRKAIELRS
jgi:hypothetical protein